MEMNHFPFGGARKMILGDGWYGGGTPILEKEKTIEDYLEVIKVNLMKKQDTIDYLRESIQTVKDEKYASEEMQKMKAKLEEAKEENRLGFPMTKGQAEAVREWRKEHELKVHKNISGYHGVSGGGYSFIFYPTAIGTSGVCRCSICHNKALKQAWEDGEYTKYHDFMKEYGGEFEFQELG